MQTSLRTRNIDSIINPNFLSSVTVKLLKNNYNLTKPLIKIKRKSKRSKTLPLHIGMVGSLCLRKGTDIFFRIAEQLHQHKFYWIGGNKQELKSHDFPKMPNNVVHYSNMSHDNVIKHISTWDWFFLSSRQDFNPYVVLEALYLGIPVIYLDGNVWQEYPFIDGIHSIDNHNNDPCNILPKFSQIIEDTKITQCQARTIHSYVADNFTQPCHLNKNSQCSQYVILSMWINLDDNDIISYYKNIIQYIRMINDGDVKVITIAKILTPESGQRKFKKLNDNILLFDMDGSPDEKELRYKKLNSDILIFMPNRGYDIGGFIVGMQYMSNQNINPKYLMYLHSKGDYAWRRDLHSIININLRKHLNHDTVVSGKWICQYDMNDGDYNNTIFEKLEHLFPLHGTTKFPFIGGTMFNTRYKFLSSLKPKLSEIYEELTHINKVDTIWVNAMKDQNIFDKYYEIYRKNPFNVAITPGSRQFLIDHNITNAYQLFQNGYKGIPDLQTEHVIERYLGYLVCHGKQMYFTYK